MFNLSDHAVEIDANYVILRGVEMKNAAVHAVLIRKSRHHIVIEDCRMTFWGRIGGPRSMGNISHRLDSGIYADNGAGHLVLQRNRIEHPRGAANDWETGHPSGPQGITLSKTSGNNVIRYNEIVSSEDHGFNDGFGGRLNFSFVGSPNRDSDIYGNIIENVWDDAIEAEGANMNVRIWGNYTNKIRTSIATADVSRGPVYIFRNVMGESRISHRDRIGGIAFKTGEHFITVDGKRVSTALGKRLIFHNTIIQPNGHLDAFHKRRTINTVTRNNILWVRGNLYPEDEAVPPNDFQHDLTTATAFLPSYDMTWYLAPVITRVKNGKSEVVRKSRTISVSGMVITVPNPGVDSGVRVPGFNDDHKGEGPDMGAFERGNPPLRFGRRAHPNTPWAPWELYP